MTNEELGDAKGVLEKGFGDLMLILEEKSFEKFGNICTEMFH